MEIIGQINHEKDIRIKPNLEQLRKLFIMPDSPDKFLEFGHELLDLIHNFFKEKGGIHSEIALPALSKIFSNIDIPKSPHLLKDTLKEIKEKVIAHSVKVGNPYYIGHMTSAIPYFMILLEMIIAALNQNQVKIETAKASSFVERELMSWIHRLIFNRSLEFYRTHIQNHRVALGNVTIDGTLANLTALVVARNKAFPAKGRFPGIRKAGIFESYKYYNCKRAVIIVSKRGHYSFDKIARIIGIGENNVIKVSVDSRNKIDLHQLRNICHQIDEENSRGGEKTRIISLIGVAGTTETGNIDNLNELRQIANEMNTYFHVDAAWGGSVLLVDQYRHLFSGIESADSVTFDAHKLLYSPLSMGMVLFRDETDLNYIKHTSNYVIRPDSVDQGRFSIEGSRPFSCLKPWATFKILGSDGFKLLFENAFELISVLRGFIERHSNFEAMNYPELFIFNYRYVPNEIQDKLNYLMMDIKNGYSAKSIPLEKKVKSINYILNDLNIELHRAIRQEDNSFVSRTMLESTRYSPQKIVVLRAITVNPLTTPEILEEIVEEHDRLGTNIYNSEFRARLEKI
jgi:glutamate decarboxylase